MELQNKRGALLKYKKNIQTLKDKYEEDEVKLQKKIEEFRCKEIKALLFDEYIRETNNEKMGVKSLTNYFGKK